jgi:hypothetical protein
MANIGGVTCDFVKGVSSGLKQRVLSWFSPGLNGQAALLLGYSDGTFSFRGVLYGTHSAVATWKVSIEALQGEVVTIVDDWGSSHSNCLITAVSPLVRTPARSNGVASSACRGELTVEGILVA